MDCLFCKISKGELPSSILYEDKELIVIKDIHPQAPFHALMIPKAHISSALQLTEDEGPMLGRMYALAAKLCLENGYTQGYRIATNIGEHGCQSVPHLHFHLLAGQKLSDKIG